MAHDGLVFLSYARADERYATDLVARLEAEGIAPWQDRLRMAPGDFEDQLKAGIDGAEYLVLVMTPAALLSPWVEKEWRYARENGVCICPIVPPLDSAETRQELDRLRAALPVWMQKIQTYDYDAYWKRFVAVLESPCQATRSPFMAADLPATVVRRSAHVANILDGILDDTHKNPSGRTTVLHGSGGFGKTTLALTVCHDDDVQAACDGGILWATLGAEPAVVLELEKLYAALTGERPGFRTPDDAMIELGRKLEGKRCLIVIDDAWELDHLKPFLHGGPQCARLVTTRRFTIAVEAAGDAARRIAVGEPTPAEREAMLTAGLAPAPGSQGRIAELARRLGNMSLLLRLANGTLREQLALGASVNEALDWALEKYAVGIAAFDEHEVVARTIELSLGWLRDDRQRALELGIFPEDTDIPFPVVQVVWGFDDVRTRDLAQRLHDLSLVTLDLRTHSLRLHDTTRGYFARRLEQPARLHAKLADAWKDASRLGRGYPVQHAVYHIVACMADPRQTVERGRQLLALLTDGRYADYLRTHGDSAALDRHLTAAIAHTATSEQAAAAGLLAALVTLRHAYAETGRDPARIFQAADEGKRSDALERLALFGADAAWDTLARLLIAWTLPVDRADDARAIIDLVEPSCNQDTLRAMLAWVRQESGTVPPGLDPPSGSPHTSTIEAILQRAGGSEGLEGLEPLDYEYLASGTDTAGFIAERDGPDLVAFALADPPVHTHFLEQYIDIHGANRYGHYRDRSLWALLDPVLRFPDAAWVKRLIRRIVTAALAGTNVEFEEFLPLAIRGVQGRAGDAAAAAAIDGATQRVLAHASGPDAHLDSWSHNQRRACVLAEILAVALGRSDAAAAFIAHARSLPKGFAGFRTFSALMLAESAAIATPADPQGKDAALTSARAAAHRIQDYRFCIQATAMVNALQSRWADPTALDLDATVERFLAKPMAYEFCTVHHIGENFEYREHGAQALPIPGDVLHASTLTAIANAFQLDAAELLPLNDWIWVDGPAALTQQLQKGDAVNVPDRDFIPILAARFAGALLASQDVAAERRTLLIQRLVPLTLPNRTALDTVLGRLLLSAAARPDDLPGILTRLPVPEEASAARPIEVA